MSCNGIDFISAGGGLLTHSQSLQLARDETTMLCLVCTPNEIARRCYNSESSSRSSSIECEQVGMVDKRDVHRPVRPILVADGTFTYESVRRSVFSLYYERLSSYAQADFFIASQFVDVHELATVAIEVSAGGSARSADKQSCGISAIHTVTDVFLFNSELYRILCETAKGGAKNWYMLFSTIYELVNIEEAGCRGSHVDSALEPVSTSNVELFHKRLLQINPRLAGTDRANQLQWFVMVCAQAGYCGAELFRELSRLLEDITGSVGITKGVTKQVGEFAVKFANVELSAKLMNELARFHIERPGVLVGM